LAQFFHMNQPSRNSPRNFLGHTRSWHSWAPIRSPYDSLTVSEPYTWCSTFLCWNQPTQTQSPIMFSLHHQSWLMMNLSSKSPKFSTPRLITNVTPVSCCTLSDGQVTRALTKRPLGYLQPNSNMLWSLSWITTQLTLATRYPFATLILHPSQSPVIPKFSIPSVLG